MTNEETLEALAEEYIKLPDLMTGEMFAPPAYKDAFKAGYRAATEDAQAEIAELKVQCKIYERRSSVETDKEIFNALEISRLNVELTKQLASQKQAASGLVEALEIIDSCGRCDYCDRLTNSALAQYRKTLEGV
jgi:hypothetical protein